jgi:hypothetical protein
MWQPDKLLRNINLLGDAADKPLRLKVKEKAFYY